MRETCPRSLVERLFVTTSIDHSAFPSMSSPPIPETISTSVLIIGAGGAGLRTSIELARRGIDCLVLGKRAHGDAHTIWAAGGINASLGSLDPEDRWEIHAADTLDEGTS